MKSLALLVCLVGTAAAGPVEPLWETRAACDRETLVEWGGTLAWIDCDTVLRVDRATGTLHAPLPIGRIPEPGEPDLGWHDYTYIEGVIGDDLVIQDGHSFAVIDGRTGTPRWRADQLDVDGGLPYLVIAGGDVIWVHPAHLGRGDPPVFVERLERATGRRAWRADAAWGSGQVEWAVAADDRIYVVTTPDMIGPIAYVAIFDLASGAQLASAPMPTSLVEWIVPGRRERVGDPTLVVGDVRYDVGRAGIVASDAADRELDRFGLGDAELVYAKDAMIVMCEDHRLRAFGPSAHATPVEHALITGTVTCSTCAGHVFPPMNVVAGDAVAHTDARGHFAIRVAARGTVTLGFDLPDLEAPMAWRGSKEPVVRLRGSGRYDLGRLTYRRDCGPLEDC